jgi:HK97 family phage major capsid protein
MSSVVVRPNFEADRARGFRSAREFFGAIMADPRGDRDERLRSLRAPQAALGSDENAEYGDPQGGYLVPAEFSPAELGVSPLDPTAGRMTELPMKHRLLHVPARVDKDHATSVSGGLRVYRLQEATERTSSRGEYERVTLEANTLVGLTYATDELVADSAPAIAEVLGRGFRDETTATLVRERLFGTGVGECGGALHAGNPSLITVAKESGQAADTIVFNNAAKMAERCWNYESAVWIANPECRRQLVSCQLVVGTDNAPLGYDFARGADGERDRLLGRPIFYSEEMKQLGDLGDLGLVVWSEYLNGFRSHEYVVSIHTRFVAGESAFRFSTRIDGRPWWRSALTPRNRTGSYTISPFVTLAERAS